MKRKPAILLGLGTLLCLALGVGIAAYWKQQACRKAMISDISYCRSLQSILDAYRERHGNFPTAWTAYSYLTDDLIQQLAEGPAGEFRAQLQEAGMHHSFGPVTDAGANSYPNIRVLLFPYATSKDHAPPFPSFWVLFQCDGKVRILLYAIEDVRFRDSDGMISPASFLLDLRRWKGEAQASSRPEVAAMLEAQIEFMEHVFAVNK